MITLSAVSVGRVLDRIDLTVEGGEIVALLGPSGSGKSTLLRAILGLTPISSGTIRIGAHGNERTPPEERNLAMVFQDLALWPHMTVRQNLAFGLEVKKVDRAERERRIRSVLETVGLGGFEDRRPDQLSGGEQQRVALARALVLDPAAMLFDEPFASLDIILEAELLGLVHRLLRTRKMTALFVTHDPREAKIIADRLAILEAGKITAVGTFEAVLASGATPFIRSVASALV
jgi:ABC-type sugar transport system ATPase subunit